MDGQSTPYSSTPNKHSSRPESEDDLLHVIHSTRNTNKVFQKTVKHFLFVHFICISHQLFSLSQQEDYTDGSISSSPILEAAATTTEDPAFFTAQGSSFFIGDAEGDSSSLSYNAECRGKEDLAGSYRYTATGATPPEVQAPPAGRSTPNGGLINITLHVIC